MTEVETFRGWMREGTARLAAVVDGLDDSAFAAPSALPDWTRAHVVGHLARNAEALHRLTSWAATGVETPMYTGPEQRGADIETSAALAPAVLRVQFRETAEDLERAMDGLDEASWQATVRSALGRVMPATQIPWMRVREVWLHAVDLDAGLGFDDLPAPLVDALLDDISSVVSAKPGCPGVVLRAVDREREWILGEADRVVVRARATELLGWVSGRTAGPGSAGGAPPPPVLPPWI